MTIKNAATLERETDEVDTVQADEMSIIAPTLGAPLTEGNKSFLEACNRTMGWAPGAAQHRYDELVRVFDMTDAHLANERETLKTNTSDD